MNDDLHDLTLEVAKVGNYTRTRVLMALRGTNVWRNMTEGEQKLVAEETTDAIKRSIKDAVAAIINRAPQAIAVETGDVSIKPKGKVAEVKCKVSLEDVDGINTLTSVDNVGHPACLSFVSAEVFTEFWDQLKFDEDEPSLPLEGDDSEAGAESEGDAAGEMSASEAAAAAWASEDGEAEVERQHALTDEHFADLEGEESQGGHDEGDEPDPDGAPAEPEPDPATDPALDGAPVDDAGNPFIEDLGEDNLGLPGELADERPPAPEEVQAQLPEPQPSAIASDQVDDPFALLSSDLAEIETEPKPEPKKRRGRPPKAKPAAA